MVIKLDTAATENNMLQFYYKARDFFHNYYYATWNKVIPEYHAGPYFMKVILRVCPL